MNLEHSKMKLQTWDIWLVSLRLCNRVLIFLCMGPTSLIKETLTNLCLLKKQTRQLIHYIKNLKLRLWLKDIDIVKQAKLARYLKEGLLTIGLRILPKILSKRSKSSKRCQIQGTLLDHQLIILINFRFKRMKADQTHNLAIITLELIHMLCINNKINI